MDLTKATTLTEEETRPDVTYLKDRIDTEALLESLNIELTSVRGDEYNCHCPDSYGLHNHGDSSPSFSYNPEKMAFNCWVCSGGGVLDLVNMVNGTTDDEAVKFLEQHSDMEPSQPEDLVLKLRSIMEPSHEEEFVPEYPPESLFQYGKIHPYLYERGLMKDVITEMQIGFDPEHCAITIPHFYMGKLVGMQRRHLAPNGKHWFCPICGDKAPKYKNTSDFPKKATLYNYDNVLAMKPTSVVVIESPFTALYLKSQGIHNVVAHFGSPITPEQCNLLVRFPHVLYWPDNDGPGHAGEKSTRAAIQNLQRYTRLEIVPLVQPVEGEYHGEDPANVSSEELADYLAVAYPASLFPILRQANVQTTKALLSKT